MFEKQAHYFENQFVEYFIVMLGICFMEYKVDFDMKMITLYNEPSLSSILVVAQCKTAVSPVHQA